MLELVPGMASSSADGVCFRDLRSCSLADTDLLRVTVIYSEGPFSCLEKSGYGMQIPYLLGRAEKQVRPV